MNAIVNKILLVEDEFAAEMHLKLLGITYNACGSLKLKNK